MHGRFPALNYREDIEQSIFLYYFCFLMSIIAVKSIWGIKASSPRVNQRTTWNSTKLINWFLRPHKEVQGLCFKAIRLIGKNLFFEVYVRPLVPSILPMRNHILMCFLICDLFILLLFIVSLFSLLFVRIPSVVFW